MSASQFLRSLRRRMIIVRAAEAAGIGMIVAAGISLVLALLLLLSGRDAMQLCVGTLTAGAAAGAGWSLLRRPTLLHAAMETDRQLNLADLLTTALTRRDTSDPWQAAVIALAEQRCADLSPSDVLLARLGARAWGGIGLSAALVLAVGALSASPSDSRATSAGTTDSAIVDSSSFSQPFLATIAQPESPPPAVTGPLITPEKMDDASPGDREMAARTAAQGSSPANGSRSAKTSVATVPPVMPMASPRVPPSPHGVDAAGGGKGDATVPPNTAQAVSGTAGTSSPSANPSPPWKASTWPQDRAVAGRAVQDGRVPDNYHDVIQRYFQPE